MYVSSYCYIRVLTLYMCPHAVSSCYICVSSFSYICVLILYIRVIILLYTCPHTLNMCPHALYACPHTALYMSSYCYTYVLKLLRMCPHTLYACHHTAIYVSSHCSIRVLILLYRHLWTRYVKSFEKPSSGSKKLEIPMEMEMSRALTRRLPIFPTRVRKWRSLLCVQVRQILKP